MDIYQVLEYGPIMAADEEAGILVTVNGAYFNVWVGDERGGYSNTDAYDAGSRIDPDAYNAGKWQGLDSIPFGRVLQAAQRTLEGTLRGEGPHAVQRHS